MDIFSKKKVKVKKRSDPPIVQTSLNSTLSQSPKSPHGDDYFSGHEGSSIRTSQSSSIPSTDSDYTNADVMTEAEIDDFFERMMSRRGIHDTATRQKMASFPIEKKRMMVSQDIQFEANNTNHHRKGGYDKKSEQESKGPDYYVRKLADTSKGINAKAVAHLAVSLRTMPLSWVRQFIDMRGLEVITELLTLLNKSKNKQELNVVLETDLLKCFKALLNNRVGAREALQHPNCVEQIVICITSPTIQSRRLVCEVLVFMCYYDVPVGQDLVLKAMDNLRDKQKGLGRFDAWLCELETTLGGRGRMGSMVGASEDFKRMAQSGPPDNLLSEYTLYNMILVNAIINVVEDPEVRIHLRNQMNASGLEKIMVKMNELCDDHIDRQVREYKAMAESDQDEMMDLYHEHVLNDLNDPRDVFECVLSSVEGTRGYDFFLSCMQHLLLINTEETNIKARYFQIIDNLVSQVVLDHKGLASDFSADYNTTVQHLFDKFADQDQLKTTLEDIKELQSDFDVLKKERDELRQQLSQQGNALEVIQLREKTTSLEDLLRMSRHTISTLQNKLRDLQSDYEDNLARAEKKLDIFYNASKQEGDGDIIISRKDLDKSMSLISTQDSLEGRRKEPEPFTKLDTTDHQNRHKSMAMGLSEEFKHQLARQFGSSTGLGEFVLPGTMPLMGSATRRQLNRRRQIQPTDSNTAVEPMEEDIIPKRKESLDNQSLKHSSSIKSKKLRTSKNNNSNDNINISNSDDDDVLSSIISSINEEEDIIQTKRTTQETPIIPQRSYSSHTFSFDTEKSLENVPSSSPSSPVVSSPPPPPPPPPLPPSDVTSYTETYSSKSHIMSPIPSAAAPPPPPPPHPSSTNGIQKQTPSSPTTPNSATPPPPPPPPPQTPFSSAQAPPAPPPPVPRKVVNHVPTVKTRQLQWQKLNASNINSTVWNKSSEKDQQLEEILETEGIFNRMEEVFAQKVIATKRVAKKEKKQEISIIDSRKAYNISISVLAKIKNLSYPEFKRKILAVDESLCTEVLLRNLLANLPSHDEMGKLSVFLKTASEEDLQSLSKADAFCAEIVSIDRFKERISNMLFVSTFHERISQLGKNMTNVMDASTNLKESQAFIDFLNIILMVGNFLNGSNFQGGAFGIRISSINKLVDTRASSNDTTLLHFLITTIADKFPLVNENLINDLELSKEACRVTIQDLIKDYNELRVGLQTLIHELDCHYGPDYEPPAGDHFSSTMYGFRDRAIEKFDQLEVRYTSMDIAYKDVVSFFGEDPSDMKPDEFFGIFQTFISSWQKAKSDLEKQKKKQEQLEKQREYQEQRKARLKTRLDEVTPENQDDKDIMDNLLEKLRSGEMTAPSKRKSSRVLARERRRTRAESMVVKAEDLLRHIQNEEDAPPLPRQQRSSISKRFTSSDRMKRLATLAEQEKI